VTESRSTRLATKWYFATLALSQTPTAGKKGRFIERRVKKAEQKNASRTGAGAKGASSSR